MRIGIDLGGTKTEIICLDADNGKELYRHRAPTVRNSYQATVKSLAALIQQAEDTLSCKGTVGIGIPGTVSSATGFVKNANLTSLNGQPLDKDLKALIGRDVRVENDANCFAVSESIDGGGTGKHCVFGVILGTGCGAGVVIDGKPLRGLNGIGGEWGHNPLPQPRARHDNPAKLLDYFKPSDASINAIYAPKPRPEYFAADNTWSEFPGEMCYCGQRGCVETWISGTGFKKEYARVNGEELSTHDIIAHAKKGEPKAAAALNRYIDRLARALAGIINVLDPDVIVLGGGMSNVEELYKGVPAVWDRYIFSDACHTPIVPPRHGDSSGVRGAAWLWNKP